MAIDRPVRCARCAATLAREADTRSKARNNVRLSEGDAVKGTLNKLRGIFGSERAIPANKPEHNC